MKHNLSQALLIIAGCLVALLLSQYATFGAPAAPSTPRSVHLLRPARPPSDLPPRSVYGRRTAAVTLGRVKRLSSFLLPEEKES